MNRYLCSLALIVGIAGMAMMSGCSAIQAKIGADVQTTTLPDINAAIADAQDAGDLDAVACFTDIRDFINSLPNSVQPSKAPGVVGVLSAIEEGRLLAKSGPPTLPPIPHQLHKDCAVIVLDAQQLAAKLGIQAAALVGGGKIAVAGAALKGQAAALKAAEAAAAAAR